MSQINCHREIKPCNPWITNLMLYLLNKQDQAEFRHTSSSTKMCMYDLYLFKLVHGSFFTAWYKINNTGLEDVSQPSNFVEKLAAEHLKWNRIYRVSSTLRENCMILKKFSSGKQPISRYILFYIIKNLTNNILAQYLLFVVLYQTLYGHHNYFWYKRSSIIGPFTLNLTHKFVVLSQYLNII